MIRHRLLCLGYFDFGSVGLFSLGFLSFFTVQAQPGQNAAADEQSSQPTDEVAAVTGLGSLLIVAAGGVAAVGALFGRTTGHYDKIKEISCHDCFRENSLQRPAGRR